MSRPKFVVAMLVGSAESLLATHMMTRSLNSTARPCNGGQRRTQPALAVLLIGRIIDSALEFRSFRSRVGGLAVTRGPNSTNSVSSRSISCLVVSGEPPCSSKVRRTSLSCGSSGLLSSGPRFVTTSLPLGVRVGPAVDVRLRAPQGIAEANSPKLSAASSARCRRKTTLGVSFSAAYIDPPMARFCPKRTAIARNQHGLSLPHTHQYLLDPPQQARPAVAHALDGLPSHG